MPNDNEKSNAVGPWFRPLTRRNALGEPYVRTPAVEHEITAVGALDGDALIARAEQLRDETLVYLIRERRRQQDWHVSQQLTALLVRRCDRIVASQLSGLPTDVRDEGRRMVRQQFLDVLLQLDTDRGDFLEVRFGLMIKRLATSAFRHCALTLVHAAVDPGGAEPDSRGASFDPQQWPDDAGAFCDARAGLHAIRDPNHRDAFYRSVVDEMPVESTDPTVMTLSRHFGKSSRTIRNWLAEAEKDLARWRRGKS